MADFREQARKAGKAAAPLGHNRETAAAGADAASDVWEEAWRRSVETCDLELFIENEALRAAVLWFWRDMREIDRMYLRGDKPELVALCVALEASSDDAARPSVDDEDGEPCPECGHPFGTPPDPLAPTCRYCQVPSPSAARGPEWSAEGDGSTEAPS